MTGSETITGFTAMSSYLPAILLSISAGVAADRGDKRRIMLTADGCRTLLVLLAPFSFLMGIISPWLMAANAFAIAIAATFFNPSRDSFIPSIVPSDKLVNANSLIQTSWQFSLLIGPAIAGLLLHWAGKIHLFTFDALFYFISFLFILLIRPSETAGIKGNQESGIEQIKEGFRYVYKSKVILPLLLLTMADNLIIMGPAIVGAPVLVKETLKQGPQVYALVQGCYAVGMLTGTALLLAYGGRFKKGNILLTGIFLDGITFIPLFFVNTAGETAIAIIIHSMTIPLLTVIRASIIQNVVPTKFTGRVFALTNIAVVGMTAISSGITGILLEITGAPLLYLIIGVLGGSCGIIGWIFAVQLRNTK